MVFVSCVMAVNMKRLKFIIYYSVLVDNKDWIEKTTC